jgi:hypothetical protein
MTQPRRAMPGTAKKSASPAERSEEFAEAQRRLKREAAERRLKAGDKVAKPTRRSTSSKPRERG